jgi:hypothetical protein
VLVLPAAEALSPPQVDERVLTHQQDKLRYASPHGRDHTDCSTRLYKTLPKEAGAAFRPQSSWPVASGTDYAGSLDLGGTLLAPAARDGALPPDDRG